MGKISRDAKAGMWYTVGNFVNRGIAFISTPIFSRLLSKEDYGQFSNFTTWASLLFVITSLDLYSSISRAYYDYEDDFDTYMSTISLLSIVFSGVCYLVVLCFGSLAEGLFGMSFREINMLFLYLIFSPAIQFFMTQQRVQGKYKAVIFVNIGSTLFSLGLSVVAVLTFQDKVWGRIIGYVLPTVVVNLVIYGLFFSKGRKFIRERAKYALLISIPMIPHHLSGGVLNNSDRLVIKQYCGNTELAVYSFAYNCAMAVSILNTSINQANAPWLYRKLKENDTEAIKTHGKELLLFFLAIVLGGMLLTPELVYILGSEKYGDSITLIPIILMGYCFQFLYTYYVHLEIFCKKTFTISMATLCAAGINLVLNFICVPRFGYWIAAVTTLISYIILWLAHYIITRRLPYKEVYDHKGMMCMMIAFSVCSVGIECLYGYPLLRYGVILLYAVLICGGAYRYFVRKKS